MTQPKRELGPGEVEELRLRLREAEQTLEAIRAGEVDSIVVEGPSGPRVYALDSGINSYRVLVEAMSEGAATLTPEGIILYCNGRLAKMLGRPLERVMGSSLRTLVPAAHQDAVDALLHASAQAESRSEIGLLTDSGEEVPALVSVSAIDHEGQRTLCLVATDLRAQKRSEEILAAERFARSVLQQAAESIVVCDATGNIIRASAAAEELSGRAPWLAPFNEIFPLSLRDRGPARGTVADAALRGETLRGVGAALKRQDGRTAEVLVSAAPVLGANGAVVGCVITLADVTQHRRAEEGLRDTDRRKNEFLGVLSHELRNPLTPIRNSIFLLERVAPDSPQALRAREVIQRQTDHLARLVDDLLDITRISHGKIDLDFTTVDLCDLVREACDDQSATFAKASVELSVDLPGGPVCVDGDALRLSQIVGNLLQNAAKFTHHGGRVVVRVSVRVPFVELLVSDTGIGIEPRDLERMFEPFEQVDRSLARTSGGLGLGLALVKEVAALHGGTVRAYSEGLGHGAEFLVTLPISGTADRARKQKREAPAARRSRRILLVEDNPDAAQSLADVLQLGGHVVYVAHDGRTGIAMARALKPEIVLCDVGLPDVDGYEVARVLKADESLRSTRVIALTGYTLDRDRQRAKEAGFDAHLAKPPALDALHELLA